MDAYLLHIFISNIFLTMIDTTIGYYSAPALARLGQNDEAETEWAIRGVRKLLAGVVAIYMFFNCLAYFGQKPLLILIVTSVILLDIVAQLVVGRKIRNQQKEQ